MPDDDEGLESMRDDDVPKDNRSPTDAELREFADLDQITYYLQGRLPPDEAAAVERRLEENLAFRHYSWPLIAAWAVGRTPDGDRAAEEQRAKHWELFKRYTDRVPVDERQQVRRE
jgi:anti-sigma factor RsiW